MTTPTPGPFEVAAPMIRTLVPWVIFLVFLLVGVQVTYKIGRSRGASKARESRTTRDSTLIPGDDLALVREPQMGSNWGTAVRIIDRGAEIHSVYSDSDGDLRSQNRIWLAPEEIDQTIDALEWVTEYARAAEELASDQRKARDELGLEPPNEYERLESLEDPQLNAVLDVAERWEIPPIEAARFLEEIGFLEETGE